MKDIEKRKVKQMNILNINSYQIDNTVLYTVEETACVLKCKVNTLYTWRHEQKIKATKSGGKLLFLGKDIKAFLGLDLKEELGTNNARIKTETPKEISGIKTLSKPDVNADKSLLNVRLILEASKDKNNLKVIFKVETVKNLQAFNPNDEQVSDTDNHIIKEVQVCL